MADDEVPPEFTFPKTDPEVAKRRQHEFQKRFLYRSVEREEMSPAKAEEAAAGAGFTFEGQHWPVSFPDPYWPLAYAALWISWRDVDRVEREWDRFRVFAGHLWRDPPHDQQRETLDASEALLWRALRAGTVHARGLPFQEADRVQVPEMHWDDLRWIPGWSKISVRNFVQDEPRYRDVQVNRQDVLTLWPMYDGVQESHVPLASCSPQPVVKDQGGRPPKIEHWHSMWIEVCRILQTEPAPPSDHLALRKRIQTWFAETGQEAPAEQTLTPIFKRLFKALNG